MQNSSFLWFIHTFITKQIITWVFNLATLSANVKNTATLDVVFFVCACCCRQLTYGAMKAKKAILLCALTVLSVIDLFDEIFTFYYNRECENLKAPPQQELWYCRECLCTLPK